MYIVMNRFKVTPGREQEFVEAFTGRAKAIDGVPGFLGLDVLKPVGEGAFISMTRWKDAAAFEAWTKSEAFARGHQKRHPGLFAGHPVLEQYEVFETTHK